MGRHPPLINNSFPKEIKEKLVNLWGSKVFDYKIEVSSEHKSRWIWKSLDGLGFDSSATKAFEKILVDRRITQTEKEE